MMTDCSVPQSEESATRQASGENRAGGVSEKARCQGVEGYLRAQSCGDLGDGEVVCVSLANTWSAQALCDAHGRSGHRFFAWAK